MKECKTTTKTVSEERVMGGVEGDEIDIMDQRFLLWSIVSLYLICSQNISGF